ncbi:MAG: transglutaminase domain-containing protein [Deltaproteobacteria bacterium]|nr:transglutaminase domain-containing protein [Deltaproteobacteria bacterium]
METPQQYHLGHGLLTAKGARFAELGALPTDLGQLCEAIQGVLVHSDLTAWLYDVNLPEVRLNEKHIRPLAQALTRIHELAPQPLTVRRQPKDRMAVVCRHFTQLLCTTLREQGIPARARVGFGAYFNPGKFEDHWVGEYWNAAQRRWILVDAQLDAVQRNTFKVDFDPRDVPRDRFIIAGDAWQQCRSGRGDPAAFGLSPINLNGLWFIAGNILRDLAALNRMELLPWDVWGMMPRNDAELTAEKTALLDQLAALTMAGDEAFPETRRLYESDERLRVPTTVFNALRNAPENIAV